jgi:serine/threonine protein phosphatase 1
MPQRTIAIGDVHGCNAALDALLQAIQPVADDCIVMLGDYIDRGPGSRQVVDRLLQLSSQCQLIPLMGNHELMLLSARQSASDLAMWLESGGRETLGSYAGSLESIPEEHLRFLEACRWSYETDSHLFVHANYHADAALEDQTEFVLFWKHLPYGRPLPHYSGKIAVLGHTPQRSGQILDAGHFLCIDTFCVGGGWLTALDVNTRQVWQANRAGQLRSATRT